MPGIFIAAPVCLRTTSIGSRKNGLSCSGAQHTNTSFDPGTKAERRLAKALSGSAKNITPNRENAPSKPAGSNRWDWASAHVNVILSTALAFSRANVSSASEISIPVTAPRPESFCAMRKVVAPAPQPISRALLSDFSSISANKISEIFCNLEFISWSCSAHERPVFSFQDFPWSSFSP